MSKANRANKADRPAGKGKRRGKAQLSLVQQNERPIPPSRGSTEPLKPMTVQQSCYVLSMQRNRVTFGCGPAGTGKTWVAVAHACEQLRAGHVERIILTRPAVSVDEEWAAVPGTVEDKYAPYLDPYLDVLHERLGQGHTEMFLKEGRIKARPLGLMRGITFKNAFVILDEAQNTTPKQMKMFLTRLGRGCTLVINGDMTQQDIRGKSGLYDAVHRLYRKPGFGLVLFHREDIVRDGIVQEIVEAYEHEPEGDCPLD